MNDREIEEMFSAQGPVTIRRTFGGKGIYHRGVIVAVELGEEVRLKADAVSAPAFAAAGAKQWTYDRDGRTLEMP